MGSARGGFAAGVAFRTDRDGRISDVKAENIPAGCIPCAAEAVRVIRDGPDWVPAVQHNKKVIYRQRQSITFVLEEEKERGGGGLVMPDDGDGCFLCHKCC